MIRFETIMLGEGEALSCRRCTTAKPSSEYTPVVEVKQRITDVLDDAKAGGVLLAGPEPMGHPALPEIVRFAASAGAARIGMRTAASAFAHGENARGAIATGLRFVEVPLAGADAVEHDARVLAPGAFEGTWAGVTRLRDAATALGEQVVVRGRVDVCAHTVASLPAMVAVFAQWGASSVVLECSRPLPGGHIDYVRAACETGMVNRVWVAVHGLSAVALGPDALHLTDVVECRGGRT